MISDIYELKLNGKHVVLFVLYTNYRDEHGNFCIVGVSDIDLGNDGGVKLSPQG